jgi:hypothetical protein
MPCEESGDSIPQNTSRAGDEGGAYEQGKAFIQ